MRVAVLDLFGDASAQSTIQRQFSRYFTKQFMAIAPQAVAAWCRSLGHETHYATYHGQQDPLSLIPDDIDVLFVACYTRYSALAYALATIVRRRKVLTVIGGPHARSFPTDCLRFFDIVVQDCDKTLIADILDGQFDPPAVANSPRPLVDIPSVEERMPDIVKASFQQGRPLVTSTVPMLASTGCPYTCSFCMDWKTPYNALARERVAADLAYLSRHWPRLLVAYHDPNFAVRFDDMMDLMDGLEEPRNPYTMESSLSILKEERLPRLARTNCVYVAPGIESWVDYSNKAGAVGKRGREKLASVVAHVRRLARHVPGIQVNFIFGGESDEGDEPAALTKEFIRAVPEVWPTINIPAPFGGTPLYDELYRTGRILSALPFSFYYTPNLAIVPKHYDPIAYYRQLIGIYETVASAMMFWRRIAADGSPVIRALHGARTVANRRRIWEFRRIYKRLQRDRDFRAFHEGRSDRLPEYYQRQYEQRLGRYAELLPRNLRRPILEPPAPPARASQRQTARAVLRADAAVK